MSGVCCLSCNSKLCEFDDICLYCPVKSENHLAIKFEKEEDVINRGAIDLVTVQPKDKDVVYTMKSANVLCKNCNSIFAVKVNCGPNHDGLSCISFRAVYFVLPNGEKVSSAINGGAPLCKEILKEYILSRNVTEFYGKSILVEASKIRIGSLTHPSIEDLSSINMNDLVKDRPRSYQLECFSAAALFSSIVYLPTGSGKTLISVMLAAYYKRLNPNHMVWFLTDRVPLVFQQARYISEQTGLCVLPLAGEVQSDMKPSQLVKYDVLVATVQLLINMILIGQLRIEDVSLVIIDEVHHAVKNHPYVVFLETFLNVKTGDDRPRVLGLTASPASGNPIQMKLQLAELSKLCRAQLITPCIYRDDLSAVVNRAETHFIQVNLTRGDSELSSAILENIKVILVSVLNAKIATMDDVRACLKELSVASRNDPKVSSKYYQVQRLLAAFEMTSVLGSHYSRPFLLDLLQEKTPLNSLSCSKHLLKTCQEHDEISPKVQALLDFIHSIDLKSNPDTRMIIFVETKRTARWLASFLQEKESLLSDTEFRWNPTAFVGQSAGNIDGMSWNTEQRPILALFRSGLIKLLISTSVLQEGLDVAACNHIVIFDRTWSLKSFVQSRGRARARNSSYTIICSADDQNYYEGLRQQESFLIKMVRDEMITGGALPLEFVMKTIYQNFKCSKLEFNEKKPSNGLGIEDGNDFDEEILEEDDGIVDDGSEYNILFILHNLNENITEFSIDNFEISKIEFSSDYLPIFPDQNQLSMTIKFSSTFMKRLQSWIVLAEDIFTQILQRYPSALIEMNRLLPELMDLNTFSISAVQLQLQRLAVGALDFVEGQYKFIEAVSQYQSFTPKLSLLLIDPLLRCISVLFREESSEKTYKIEIPFDSIDCFCLISSNPVNSDDDSNYNLTVPMRKAPYLFVTEESVSAFNFENRANPISWSRVTDDSFSSRFSGAFGLCPVLRFDLFLNGTTSRSLFSALKKCNVNLFYTNNLVIEQFPEYHNIWSYEVASYLEQLDFEKQYLVKAVMSETWAKTSLKLTLEWFELASTASNTALDTYILKSKRQCFENPVLCLKSAIEISSQSATVSDNYNDFKSGLPVKFVTWTPSRLIFHKPTIVLSNRVLREFGSDKFIRVHFRDEDLQRISTFKNDASIDNILNHGVSELLKNGIQIGSKQFDFLAMSASQLRSHGCWFISNEIGADNIRAWLGTFDEIKNVAKYAARLGQSFSASLPTTTVDFFEEIPDWEANGYCFSDGCGMISPQFAELLSKKLNLSYIPSAFQIRFAGFKGVVAISPKTQSLALRPSMKKFKCHHNTMDILNCSVPIPCFLNRQVIMILSTLGVPDSAFEALQLKHLINLAESFVDNSKVNPKRLDLSNISSWDPFMRMLIAAQYRQQLVDLVKKSRIYVPDGRILIGVVDETGTLAEDEIFCQLEDEAGVLSVVEGTVLIAKNPCMHPGDVRVLKAVRNPELQPYSRNVLVFSRQGARPVPNMCSGSDLDGDLYFITWDPTLIPPSTDLPMSYEGLSATVKDSAITVEDLQSFFVDFIRNDQLGTIANSHVAFSDQLPLGVRDPTCTALARLFALAVDFPKTGFVAKVPKEVRVEKYPDFMQKFDKPAYVSHRIIGKLFREIRAIMFEGTDIDLHHSFTENYIDKDLLYPGYENFVLESRILYKDYCKLIGNCLSQYGFRRESHLLMQCVVSMDVSLSDLSSELLEIAELTVDHYFSKFKNIFYDFCHQISENNGIALEEVHKMVASAWYYVSYSDPITPEGLDAPILSFPWIIKTANLFRFPNSALSGQVLFEDLLANELKRWFESEEISSVNALTERISLLSQIKCLFDMKFCFKNFLLTGNFVIISNVSLENVLMKLVSVFPSLKVIKNLENYLKVEIESCELCFVNRFECSELKLKLLENGQSEESFYLLYLLEKWIQSMSTSMNEKENEENYKRDFERILSHFKLFSFDVSVSGSVSSVKSQNNNNFIDLDQIPAALDEYISWTSNNKANMENTIFTAVSRELLSGFKNILKNENGGGSHNNNNNNNNSIEIEETDDKIRLFALKSYHSLMRTLKIDSIFANQTLKLNNSKIKLLVKEPKIMRQVTFRNSRNSNNSNGNGSNLLGSSFFVQGASALIFSQSQRESDQIVFKPFEGIKQLKHLSTPCYKILLKTPPPNLLSDTNSTEDHREEDKFAFHEFWAHFHRQLLFASKFGGPEFGKLSVSVKLGQVYATELPKMFFEQIGTIMLARVALDRSFRSSKSTKRHRKVDTDSTTTAITSTSASTGDNTLNHQQQQPPISNSIDSINLSNFKFNPKDDSVVNEAITSSRAAQSLQSLLDSLNIGTKQQEGEEKSVADEEEEEENEISAPKKMSKKAQKFGKLLTSFESSISESAALKFMKTLRNNNKNNNKNEADEEEGKEEGKIKIQTQVGLISYDEESNTNCPLHLTFDSEDKLVKFGFRGLRWSVVDIISPEKDADLNMNTSGNFNCGDSRIVLTSSNQRQFDNNNNNNTAVTDSIFNTNIVSLTSNGKLQVKEQFRSNPTIYARQQTVHGSTAIYINSIGETFDLSLQRVKEGFGVDPTSGLFALSQEKWELEAKLALEWEKLNDYQYRDKLIYALWKISKTINK